MKANRQAILFAVKKSADISELTARLGLGEESEEKVWDKLLRFHPGAEDYLKRNESLREMRERFADDDLEGMKESRLEFVGATCRLMQNKLI